MHSKNKQTHGFHTKHALGQNFLLDESLLDTLCDLTGVGEEDNVLEIGTGMGTFTKRLSLRAHQVLTYEVDDSLIPMLRVFFEKYENITLIHQDVLEADLQKDMDRVFDAGHPLRVAANIPYYITTPIIERLLISASDAESISLMVQEEVADKLLAGPREEGYAPLPAFCQVYYNVRKALPVPASCFNPQPKVDSSFVVMEKKPDPLWPADDARALYRAFRKFFALRRKTLVNTLMNQFSFSREQCLSLLSSLQMEEKVRSEELSVPQLVELHSGILKMLEEGIK